MRTFPSLILLLALTAAHADGDEKPQSECVKEAHKYFPDPNFKPQTGGAGTYGSPGGRTDFTTSAPSASDFERARQNRQQYIEECMAGKGRAE